MPKGCWKTGTGYSRKIWINAPNVQIIPVWAQTVLLVSDNLHGTGKRWNRKPGSTCLLAHGMVWLAVHLQCCAEGALLSGYWPQILMWSRISWMDEFSDWKRPNPIPCCFIFSVSSSLANSPLQCSSCEIRFMKQDLEDLFSLWSFKEALGHAECYRPHLSGGDIKACLASPSILCAVRQGLYFQAQVFVFFPTSWLLFAHGCSQTIGESWVQHLAGLGPLEITQVFLCSWLSRQRHKTLFLGIKCIVKLWS